MEGQHETADTSLSNDSKFSCCTKKGCDNVFPRSKGQWEEHTGKLNGMCHDCNTNEHCEDPNEDDLGHGNNSFDIYYDYYFEIQYGCYYNI